MSFPGDGGSPIADEGQGMPAGPPVSGRRPKSASTPVSWMAGNEDSRTPETDFSLRAPHFPVSLEKWYIDVLAADGTVCLVYVGTLALCGRRLNRVTAELFRPGAASVRGSARVGALVGGPGFLRSAVVSIEGERLRFNTDGLSGDLVYRARFAPWRLRESFLSVGRRTLTWSAEIPDADVEGRLSWPGGSMAVRGRGYRDRVWFDILPWRFPISRLVRGGPPPVPTLPSGLKQRRPRAWWPAPGWTARRSTFVRTRWRPSASASGHRASSSMPTWPTSRVCASVHCEGRWPG